jgi:hypothetical protein
LIERIVTFIPRSSRSQTIILIQAVLRRYQTIKYLGCHTEMELRYRKKFFS